MVESETPRNEPAMGGTLSGNLETATEIWSVPTIFPVVGSKPIQPPPGR